jgi:hypothetical protein
VRLFELAKTAPVLPPVENGKAEKPAVFRIWHGPCYLGILTLSVTLNLHKRGGDRSKTTSDCLTRQHVLTIISAAQEAMDIGLAFNLFVSIHWTRAGLTDAQAARATGRLIKLASNWMRSRGGWLPWAWVRENSTAGDDKGSHVHIMLHCPAGLPLARQFRRWLKRIIGHPYKAGVILTKRIGGTLSCHRTSPDLYRENLQTVVGYVAKGAPQGVLDALHIDRIHEPQGLIIGKRAARWQRSVRPLSDSALASA